MGDAEPDVSASERVEQLLAESEALLASIASSEASSSLSPRSLVHLLSSPPICPVPRATGSGGVTRPTASGSSAPIPKRARNSTRDRMQHELQFLRNRVGELEEEIHTKTRVGQGISSACEVLVLDSQPVLSAWQRLVQRQKRARALSQKENRSLRRRVAELTKLIQGIRELMLAHQHSAVHWRYTHRDHLIGAMLITGWEEAAEFARLKRHAVSAFAALRHVLVVESANGAPESLSRMEDVFSHAYDEQTQRFVSRLTSTRLFPFNNYDTSNATWRAIFTLFGWRDLLAGGSAAGVGRVDIVAQSGFQVVERGDDTYAVKYAVTLSLGGTAQVVVSVKDVVMRFAPELPDQTVVIWETLLDTSSYDANSAAASGAAGQAPPQIRGSGWIVVHEQPGACSSSVMRSTFDFSTQRATNGDGKVDSKVQLMQSWVTLGESCIDSISLEVDKSLL